MESFSKKEKSLLARNVPASIRVPRDVSVGASSPCYLAGPGRAARRRQPKPSETFFARNLTTQITRLCVRFSINGTLYVVFEEACSHRTDGRENRKLVGLIAHNADIFLFEYIFQNSLLSNLFGCIRAPSGENNRWERETLS